MSDRWDPTGDAITALAHRARNVGIPDPDQFAREFIAALRMQGWRPPPPPKPMSRPADPERTRQHAEQIRQLLHAARTRQEDS